MSNKWIPVAVVIGALVLLVVLYKLQPSRMTLEQIRESRAAENKLNEIEEQRAALETEEQEAIEGDQEKIPGVFKVKFACSNGDFVVECHQDWAPIGVERLRMLVQEGFFNGARFFRVVTRPKPFVVQFGISGHPVANLKWREAAIKDDPVRQSNTEGTITFAKAGPNSRTTQVFINLADNSGLDKDGFAAFGKVVEGMDVVKSFNDQYQDKPLQASGQYLARGNAFIDKAFPGLDYIKTATIVE